jgi:hypothetical protein
MNYSRTLEEYLKLSYGFANTKIKEEIIYM